MTKTSRREKQDCGRARLEGLHGASTKGVKKTSQTKLDLEPKHAHEHERKVKRRRARSNKSSTIRALTAPLSVLMDGPDYVPVRNVGLWVDRSADMRRVEAEMQNGYIKRPLNAFMLYRFAYINRAKSWCLDNQQDNLSIVIGKSWCMERDDVCNIYKEFARIEKTNHRIAYPEYKFRPRKTQNLLHQGRSRSSGEDGARSPDADPSNLISHTLPIAPPMEAYTPSVVFSQCTTAPAEPYLGIAPEQGRVCDSQWLLPSLQLLPPWLPVDRIVGAGYFQYMVQNYLSSSGDIEPHVSAAGTVAMDSQVASTPSNGLERIEYSSAFGHNEKPWNDYIFTHTIVGGQYGGSYR